MQWGKNSFLLKVSDDDLNFNILFLQFVPIGQIDVNLKHKQQFSAVALEAHP